MKFRLSPTTGRWVKAPEESGAEHEHQWQDAGVTKVIGSVTFAMDSCRIRGCECRRARRSVEEHEERSG